MLNEKLIGKLYTYFNKKGYYDYRNDWITGPCPDCGENRDGKYAIDVQGNRSNCFICGNKDKPLEVVRKIEGLNTISQVYQIINGLEVSNYIPSRQDKKEKEVQSKENSLPEEFKLIGIYKNKSAQLVERNLRNRGFNLKSLMLAGVGYCLSGEYQHRIIIPYFSNGKLIYFNARRFIELGSKFKNPDTEGFGIGKNQIIYNIDALHIYNQVYLFESATNALTLGLNATATGGKILSPWQISTYIASPCKEIIIGLDDDAYIEALELALKLCPYKKVKVLKFPKGKDANKVGKKETLKLKKETPFKTYKEFYKDLINERTINPY